MRAASRCRAAAPLPAPAAGAAGGRLPAGPRRPRRRAASCSLRKAAVTTLFAASIFKNGFPAAVVGSRQFRGAALPALAAPWL